MAIGIAKLFGFCLMQNFNYPYFSRDITEFWKRWHISLVTWFRDYVFLPMSFNISHRIKGEKVLFVKTDLFIYALASLVVWFLTGLWHGANYTFIVWGMIHGFVLILYRWQLKPRKGIFKKLGINNNNKILVVNETLLTLFVVMMAWVIFRSDSVGQAFGYISGIFTTSLISFPHFWGMKQALIVTILFISFFFMEWFGRKQQYAIADLGRKWKRLLRWAMYSFLIFFIGMYMQTKQTPFIYLQF